AESARGLCRERRCRAGPLLAGTLHPAAGSRHRGPADGGVVLVLASEAAAKRRHANPVWIRGIGWASDSPTRETRAWTQAAHAQLAAEMAYRLAKVRRPATEIDFAGVDDRFSYKELQP